MVSDDTSEATRSARTSSVPTSYSRPTARDADSCVNSAGSNLSKHPLVHVSDLQSARVTSFLERTVTIGHERHHQAMQRAQLGLRDHLY